MSNAKLAEKPIQFQSEPLSAIKDELVELTKKHFVECNVSGQKFPFALDEPRMNAMADLGILQITTARDGNKLVGYLANVVNRNMLYDALCSYHIGWYVLPEYRGKLTGLYLLDQAEKFLKEMGVVRMYGAHTDELDASSIFKRLGWQHIEHNYSKLIGD